MYVYTGGYLDAYIGQLPLILKGVLQSNIVNSFFNFCGRQQRTSCELFIASKTLQIVLPRCKWI